MNILKGNSDIRQNRSSEIFFTLALSALLFHGCSKEPVDPPGTMRDIDGNIYKTVTISGQTWMAENLRVTHYNDGSPVIGISENRDWEFDETGMSCDYKFIADNKRGKLYNWYAIEEKVSRRLAPKGWHIPSAKEWQALVDAMGNSYSAGYRLKDNDSWPPPANYYDMPPKSGFDALPGGIRDTNGNFEGLDKFAIFWTSTTSVAFCKTAVYISAQAESVAFFSCPFKHGLSVRCVKDR